MCPQERASLISIVTNLLVNAVVLFRLQQMFEAGALDGPDAPNVWAGMVIWAVPAALVTVLGLHALVALALRGRSGGPAWDERDRLFQVRGMCVSTVVFGVGLIGALIGLANDWSPLSGLLTIYYSASLGDVLGNGVRIASYRIGC